MANDAPNETPRILVVEDEFLIALETEDLLRRLGCETIGPAPSVAKAMALLERDTPDFALLDVNLGSERSTPIADLLFARRIPYALATGYDALQLSEPSLSGVPALSKPVTLDALRSLLAKEIGLGPDSRGST